MLLFGVVPLTTPDVLIVAHTGRPDADHVNGAVPPVLRSW